MNALWSAGPLPDGLDGFARWALTVMSALGAPGAGLVVALENLVPPLPSEAVLPLAGFAAGRGEMSLAAALFWTTAGSVVGAAVLYALAAAVGLERVRAVAARMPLVAVADVDRAQAWFARHGAAAVFLGRMVPVVRSLISVPAGVARMRPAVFLALTGAGSLAWNALFVLAGYGLGANWALVARYADVFEKVVIVGGGAVVVGLAVAAVVRARRRVGGRHRPAAHDEP